MCTCKSIKCSFVRYTYDLGLADKRGNLFKELNVDLRMLSTLSGDDHESLKTLWAPFITNMLSAMSKVPKRDERRFFRGRPESWTDVRLVYQAGREVVWAGFTSCSTSLDQAAYLAGWNVGCVLELTLFNVQDISPFSFYPNEQEVLLPPNTRLIVLDSTRTETCTASDGQRFLVKIIPLQQIGGLQLIS